VHVYATFLGNTIEYCFLCLLCKPKCSYKIWQTSSNNTCE